MRRILPENDAGTLSLTTMKNNDPAIEKSDCNMSGGEWDYKESWIRMRMLSMTYRDGACKSHSEVCISKMERKPISSKV